MVFQQGKLSMGSSKLEETFLALWRTVAKQPDPEREYQFAKEDGRRWRNAR